ncbi:glycosyltransferase [Dactylosporangium darangshiense]|uniref:Glycosyl transferase family 1 domain-containing protein n=1 Tax=Dactylosporangium darangshiense TaxID=579108 RepID=A0ABP8DIE5_9ACTN
MKIDIVHPGYLPLQPAYFTRYGLGGNETAMLLASRCLAELGHQVRIYADCEPDHDYGVDWRPLADLNPGEYRDVIMFWVRTKGHDPSRFNAPIRIAKLGLKTPNETLLGQVQTGAINLLIAFSDFQRQLYCQQFGFPGTANWLVTADGLDIRHYDTRREKTPGKYLHAANPKRGLCVLLDMWPAIREQQPDAELYVASSHLLRGFTAERDQALAGDLYTRARAMAPLGVRFLGRIPKPQLIEHQLTAEIYLYPTTYPETCCIAALEASAAGAVIVTSPSGALPDRVIHNQSGLLIPGDPATPAVRDAFVRHIGELAADAQRRQRMSRAAHELAREHDYHLSVLPAWLDAFEQLAA